MNHNEKANTANLSTEDVDNLQRLEKDFRNQINKEVILIAYEK